MAKDFIAKVLVKNPSQRLKTPEMREHPWLTSNFVSLIFFYLNV